MVWEVSLAGFASACEQSTQTISKVGPYLVPDLLDLHLPIGKCWLTAAWADGLCSVMEGVEKFRARR